MSKEMKNNEINLQLSHDYLSIEVCNWKGEIKKITLPVRSAKIISDMYKIRNAKEEKKDLIHYASCKTDNFDYNVLVHMMQMRYDTEVGNYFSKHVPKFTEKQIEEKNK